MNGLRYKFDDERVTKEDMKKALDELFGGEEEVSFSLLHIYGDHHPPPKKKKKVCLDFIMQNVALTLGSFQHLMQTNTGMNITPFKFTKHSNAYMLVYIRESDKDKIMCNVDENDIAAHLRVILLCIVTIYCFV